jgi:PEP-CTERM motif
LILLDFGESFCLDSRGLSVTSFGFCFLEEGMKMHTRLKVVSVGGLLAGLFAAAPVHADLIHQYSFATNADDSVGTANGTLMNSATVSGGVLNLNNPNFSGPSTAGGYLSLPPSILPSSGSATIEEWFTFTGSGFFTEGWAFSNSDNDTNIPNATSGQYLMHAISAPQPATPPGGANTGGDHVAQSISGYAGGETDAYEETPNIGADGGGYLDDGETFFSATVIDASAGTLSFYLYDESAGGVGGLQEVIPAIPLSDYSFTNAYLGRSAFAGDNSTSGTIYEYRIYDDAQSAAGVAADEAVGPYVVAPIQAVPEPASLSLMAIGAIGLARRRARR